ncbi:MAG: hypothetical protein BMS9Abin04_257 [Planctomycetia bacterium]|nr:MAG: hypothetical protein BMS9Abin04_257 [Planctomycetia bacterium]
MVANIFMIGPTKRRPRPLRKVVWIAFITSQLVVLPAVQAAKTGSTLYPAEVVQTVRGNVDRSPWGRACRDAAVAAARPWRDMSDDQLWGLVFGPGITRSWMVWSNGYCPACRESVPMYNWRIAALEHPWKVQCPHCEEFFPKNDFQAFYRSGLDSRGLFDPARADRSLLVNAEHPDPADPLYRFGVDDGEGYREKDKRWRFIGAYLIYGQWKQAVVEGLRDLGAAYLLTGDAAYAHKAGILLDRVADVWPEFDFKSQAVIYEKRLGSNGYVSVWHDSCPEVREMAQVYDMVFEALRQDRPLLAFLAEKAARHGLENPKATFADVQRNIEERILRDTLRNKYKIHSNYPRQEITLAVILVVLGLDEHRQAYQTIVDAMLEKATAVDGVTGEKGLANYAAGTIMTLAQFLSEMDKSDAGFLPDAIRRFPNLKRTYRFHIDTHCLGRYYPHSGDTGWFAGANQRYVGMALAESGPGIGGWTAIEPSSYTLLWRLYELTGDVAYVQTMVRMNGGRTEGLPYDLFVRTGDEIRQKVGEIVRREGDRPVLDSVNLQDWHLAILRSGRNENARALWLDYDSGGGHGHADGMNLGLYAYGLDLMPDFGYPPVQYGGWGSPRARWYKMSAAHNTVVVDGENSRPAAGTTTMWADGERLHVVRAAGAALNRQRRFERTAVLVDVAAAAFYVVDLVRVEGGSDHTRFMHSHFGTVTTRGLTLKPGPGYDHGTQMRSFRWDSAPAPGWSVDWQVEDRYGLLPPGRQVHLRSTDLTDAVEVGLAEAWIVAGSYDSGDEVWIPQLVVRRRKHDATELSSTFVAVIDPYEDAPTVTSARRLPLENADGGALPATNIAVQVMLADGGRDVLLLQDPAAPAVATVATEPVIRTDAEIALVRFAPDGQVSYAALARGSQLTCGQIELAVPAGTVFLERTFIGP